MGSAQWASQQMPEQNQAHSLHALEHDPCSERMALAAPRPGHTGQTADKAVHSALHSMLQHRALPAIQRHPSTLDQASSSTSSGSGRLPVQVFALPGPGHSTRRPWGLPSRSRHTAGLPGQAPGVTPPMLLLLLGPSMPSVSPRGMVPDCVSREGGVAPLGASRTPGSGGWELGGSCASGSFALHSVCGCLGCLGQPTRALPRGAPGGALQARSCGNLPLLLSL